MIIDPFCGSGYFLKRFGCATFCDSSNQGRQCLHFHARLPTPPFPNWNQAGILCHYGTPEGFSPRSPGAMVELHSETCRPVKPGNPLRGIQVPRRRRAHCVQFGILRRAAIPKDPQEGSACQRCACQRRACPRCVSQRLRVPTLRVPMTRVPTKHVPTTRCALLLLLACGVALRGVPATSQTLLTTIPTGSHPVALAPNPASRKLYVANQVQQQRNRDHVNELMPPTIPVGSYPTDIAANPVTNKIYVANQSSNTATVIDGVSGSTSTVATGRSPVALALPMKPPTRSMSSITTTTASLPLMARIIRP